MIKIENYKFMVLQLVYDSVYKRFDDWVREKGGRLEELIPALHRSVGLVFADWIVTSTLKHNLKARVIWDGWSLDQVDVFKVDGLADYTEKLKEITTEEVNKTCCKYTKQYFLKTSILIPDLMNLVLLYLFDCK